eukprot:2341529-Amphidinium_carterae.1
MHAVPGVGGLQHLCVDDGSALPRKSADARTVASLKRHASQTFLLLLLLRLSPFRFWIVSSVCGVPSRYTQLCPAPLWACQASLYGHLSASTCALLLLCCRVRMNVPLQAGLEQPFALTICHKWLYLITKRRIANYDSRIESALAAT